MYTRRPLTAFRNSLLSSLLPGAAALGARFAAAQKKRRDAARLANLGAAIAARSEQNRKQPRKQNRRRADRGQGLPVRQNLSVGIPQTLTNVSNALAPSVVGTVARTSVPATVTRIPFSNLLPVFSSASGELRVGSTTGPFNLVLDPNTTIGGQPVFGQLSNVASYFRRYRLTSLNISFSPNTTSTTSGSFCFAVVNDGAISGSGGIGYQVAVTYAGATVTPVWQAATIPSIAGVHFDNDWLWTQDGTSTSAEERQTSAGTVVCSGISVLAPTGALFGFLKLEGMIELKDLAPVSTLVPAYSKRDQDETIQRESGVNLGISPPTEDYVMPRLDSVDRPGLVVNPRRS